MPTRRTVLSAALALPAAAMLSRPAFAAKPQVFATGGVAINGIDPVAYFTEASAVPGDPAITSDWNGARMQFASPENKAMFDADPEAFAPKYGGYCAYAVSKGATAPTDPEAWTIYDGRLYLNFSTDVRSLWRQDIPGNVALADANWPGVLDA